ncbi:MAG: hss [Caballeronia sp.]|jgi:homospermidine synthase|uniref:homospermidine synthase n=1 Tax=Caballeronia sp. TaxID=1931223 RepID=UPI00261D9E7B|nr:saccharopine dehydrogenase NADP-binding domain-containing protein [Caballeronia sp.]MDB5837925.1 hss [Caballeronia sp.]
MDIGPKYATFAGHLVMVGFGSIGQSILPMLFRHLGIDPSQVKIICLRTDDPSTALEYGVETMFKALTPDNYEAVLGQVLREGDFLLNLSVNVSSIALIRFCWRHGALYLDTSIEPWPQRWADGQTSLSHRSNYALREEVLAFRLDKRTGPTAVVTHGANPGLASALVKQALLNMALQNRLHDRHPSCYEDWAALARRLGVKAIHIAERDTQFAGRRKKRDEFVNTWSVDAFVEEGLQPSELGWGSHEQHWPDDAKRHGFGCDAAVYLTRPGFSAQVRSWTPLGGPYNGYLITHGESISITDHLTLREEGEVVYRPTVNYAYRPCEDALLSIHELADRDWRIQSQKRVIRDEATEGVDELGVLLMGNKCGVYWLGSRLSIAEARRLIPHNTATSLQVVAGVLGGMVWVLNNPRAGVVEPDDVDYRMILNIARPYLGELIGVYDDWTPLRDRSTLYPGHKDEHDPWQFINFRVP